MHDLLQVFPIESSLKRDFWGVVFAVSGLRISSSLLYNYRFYTLEY